MLQKVNSWIGRSEAHSDTLRTEPARFMQATIGREPTLQSGDILPPLWHWLYFLEAKPLGELGRDGHPKKGGFLPPVALPRRMWAGGRFAFKAPIPLGSRAKKRSTIKHIAEKSGRTGALCFVTVLHELFLEDGTLALTEEHDIVYREDPHPDAPKPVPAPAPSNAEVSEMVSPSQVMLFRYSALTFNGHRVHYDVDYARSVEGYDGLVFHGPLTATLLIDLAQRTVGQAPRTFEFRGLAPLAGMDPFHLEGTCKNDTMQLWARRHDGAKAMQATATF
ncbi:MaoC family dehydratase N-terminal domain-containing protein [Ruegeria sp. R14_0]|uniref:FAS1-like dehydratase domain-containing protein n=1 Tax=Ruegeria sp. R14_0 TaxID=2821100 RepID=UPI001AD9A757|nr:MaoC family dehydratase N-terminal domain-containing protein [Ruegeria sp. R14_0]MBO9446654.1 MaoC family dehydratase N-terminal domain-containing protein [Ruegeria sp. R14_0]